MAGIVPVARARVVLTRIADGSVAVDSVIDISPGSDSLDLDLRVVLLAQSETFEFRISLVNAAGDTVFRAGPLTVTARAAGSGSSEPTPVELPFIYIGVGANAATVEITLAPASGISGDVLTFAAVARDGAGNEVPGTPIAWWSPDPGRLIVADSAVGSATVGNERGSGRMVAELLNGPRDTALVNTQPAPTTIAPESGSGQSGTVGAQLTNPLVALVTAADGSGVQGVTVEFGATLGGGSVGSPTVVTDANGRASTTRTLGPTVGAQATVASSTRISGSSATFTATGTTASATGVQIVAGNNQSGTAGSALGINPSVQVFDQAGNPLVGAEVTFAIASGGGSIAGAVQTTVAGGFASSGAWTLGQTAGTNTLTATVTGFPPALFTATGNPGAVTTLVIVSGNNQSANAGSALPQPLVIEARDQFTNAVPTVAINWTVSAGSANPISGTTGTNGRFQTVWTLGTTAINQTATASSGALTSPQFNATAVFPTPTILLAVATPGIVGVGRTATLNITLSQPAPAGGVTVTVTSDNQGIVSIQAPGTAVIAQGASTGQVTLNGVSAGITNVNAATAGYTTGVLAVTASLNIISLPTTLNVPFGQTASIPVQLAIAAPAGGTVVTLTSTNPAAVAVTTPTVTVAAGTQLINGTLSGVAPGTASVIASATGYVFDTSAVATTAALNIVETTTNPNASFGNPITIRLESGGGQIPAPSPGVQVTLTSRDPACAATNTPRTIPTGLVTVSATITYAGTATLPCTTRVVAEAPNIDPDSLNVTISPAPIVTLNAVTNVGSGLQESQSGFLGATNHGGVTVRITSADPAVLRVSPDVSTAGTAFIDIPIGAGFNSFSYYTHGMEGMTGTINLTATAPGFTDATPRAITVLQPAFDIIFLGTVFTTLSANDPFQLRTGIPNGQLTGLTNEQAIRVGGIAVTGTVVNSNAAVAQLVTTPLTGQSVTVGIAAGQARSPTTVATGGVDLDLIGAGATTVSATIPGFAMIATASVGPINVTAPVVTLNAVTNVGSGLQESQSGSLGATAHGGVNVRITSSNPAVLLVSPNATTAGTAFIDVPVADGNNSFSYYSQGLEGQTGTSDMTATVTGFTDATPRTVTVLQPAFDIIFLGTTFTTLAANDAFQLRTGIPNGPLTGLTNEQAIRAGGNAVTGTVVNSNAAVAQLVTTPLTGQSVTVGIAVGQARSPGTVATGGVDLDLIGAGATTVSATIPGFATIATASVGPINVTAPAVTLNGVTNVGSGLQESQSGSLGATAHGGVNVRITSSNPAVMLISPNATTAGTAFIDVPVADGANSFSYYTQGLEGQTGTSDVTATVSGFTDATPRTVTVLQPAFDIIFLGTAFTTLTVNDPFQVRLGIPNAGATGLTNEQALRAGGTAAIATVVNSNVTAGQLVTTALTANSVQVTIPVGQARSPTTVALGGVEFDPLASGTTTVSATIPGFAVITTASVGITISAPAITMNATTSTGAGLQESQSGNLAVGNHGGVTVRLTSSNPSVLLLSANATTAGTAFIDVVIPNNQTSISYFTQGVEGASGTVSINAQAGGFLDGNISNLVQQAAIDIIFLITTNTVAGANDDFQVRTGIGNGANMTNEQSIRAGGTNLTATIANSNATVGQLTTTAGSAQTRTVQVVAGQARSPTSVATGGVAFDPLAAGQTTVSVQTAAGFVILTSGAVIVVTVN